MPGTPPATNPADTDSEDNNAQIRRANGDSDSDSTHRTSSRTSNMADEEARISASQLATISDFDGTTDVDAFISDIEMAALGFAWDDLKTYAAARQKLKGKARLWHDNQILGLNKFDSWKHENPHRGLKAAIIDRYGDVMTVIQAVKLLEGLQQKEKENVRDFYDRVFRAVHKSNFMYSDNQKQENEYQAHFQVQNYKYFYSGLRDDIKKGVGGKDPPKDIQALLKAAREVEKDIKMITDPKIKFEEEVSEVKDEYNQEVEDLIETEVAELRRRYYGNPRGGLRGSGFQGQTRGRGQQRGRGGQGFTQGGGQRRCFYCDDPNHLQPQCQLRQVHMRNKVGPFREGRGRGGNRGNFSFRGTGRIGETTRIAHINETQEEQDQGNF